MKIVLYRDDSACSADAAAFLREKGIPFEEVDVGIAEGFARLVKRTRAKSVPAVEIKRGHGIMIIDGLDKGLLEKEILMFSHK